MDSTFFVVDEQEYCVLEVDLRERNNEFLDGLDDGHVDYCLDVHGNSEDEQHAAMALRKELHHSLETFFSLVGAYLQAPDCVYGWLAKCRNEWLYSLVGKIDRGEDVFNKWQLESVGWEQIANSVFRFIERGTDKQIQIVQNFATMWSRLASEFLDSDRRDEYNSIKHGYRVSPGGFSLFAGIEETPGEPAKEMHAMGGSKFGTSFFRVTQCEPQKNRCHVSRRVSLNWNTDKIAGLLELVSVSTKNVLSALKISNGQEASNFIFHSFTDDKDYGLPWTFSTGAVSCSIDRDIPSELVPTLTRSDLQEKIRQYQEQHAR